MSARAGGSDVSAGTCHAPHTTAMRWCPARTAARMPCRIVASLRRSRRVGVQPSPSAAARSSAMASATAANSSSASPPSRCSTTSSHQRSGSSCPAALDSQPSGSSLISPAGAPEARSSASSASSPARTVAAARSTNRAGNPASIANRMACHSGEKSANGQKAERPGLSGACASIATGGTSAVTCVSSGSASGGPSIRIVSGARAPSADRTARAEPGP